MRGDEDRDIAGSREIAEQTPEFIACQRIDARGRLVKDQQLGVVNDPHGQRKALSHAERQRVRFGVGIVDKADIDHELGDTRVSVVRGQMKKAGMKTQVLPHGEFAIERERLRHEADELADRRVRFLATMTGASLPGWRGGMTKRCAVDLCPGCRAANTASMSCWPVFSRSSSAVPQAS